MSIHKIINGDSRLMGEISDSSVDLIITSPPYWQLKDYGTEEQIGYNDTYEQYINNLNLVWKESERVLHPGCRLCINIGDQFARSAYYGRYKVIPIRTEIIKFCENIGFDYMGSIIWQKITSTNTSGGGVQMGSYPFPRNGVIKIDYEFILIFKKQGKQPKFTKEQKEKSRMTPEEWNTYFSGHWNFPGVKQKSHIAMFPEELPHRLIKMFSFVGDTVLDPFFGSGTTTLAASKLDRNSIGYEINPEFIDISKSKLNVTDLSKNDIEFVFEKQGDINCDFNKLIDELPYKFKDPLFLDKKTDLKKLNFGNKISKNDSIDQVNYFIVKEIISPVSVVLNNGKEIKLLGLRQIDDKFSVAVEFMSENVLGKKVYLKSDEGKM
ncbi:MAG: site-specific DNA-methyltransferase [Saprospiraceae bacterium]